MNSSKFRFSPAYRSSNDIPVSESLRPRRIGKSNFVFLPPIALVFFLCSLTVVSSALFGQNSPKITGVEPATGKANDAVTVKGENLAKGSVTGMFLSDDKTDYKAEIVEQGADKIVFKVPQVKAGGYNVSILVGNNILIQPLRFAVQ